MLDVKKIADEANMIINGYAYTLEGDFVRVLNINRPDKAAVLSLDGQAIETTMDDIELQIVTNYYDKNKTYLMEAVNA